MFTPSQLAKRESFAKLGETGLLKTENQRYRGALVHILNYPIHSEPIGVAMDMQRIAADALVPTPREKE